MRKLVNVPRFREHEFDFQPGDVQMTLPEFAKAHPELASRVAESLRRPMNLPMENFRPMGVDGVSLTILTFDLDDKEPTTATTIRGQAAIDKLRELEAFK